MRSSFLSSIKSVIAVLLVFAGCAASCKRDVAKTVAVNPASAAAVKVQLDVLRDSVAVKWRTMIASDDQKIGTVRLLLRELQAQPGANPAQLQALEHANARLLPLRYTPANDGQLAPHRPV